MTRLLVSVRGPKEAIQAARGGAHILDVEYPKSALGTVYPLNIVSVRRTLDAHGFARHPVSTNIGERQTVRSTACQAALGVATAGASMVKCGLAKYDYQQAEYLGQSLVRTVKHWYKTTKVIPSVFVDPHLCELFDPFVDSIKLLQAIKADGILIDTFNKKKGLGLLDYASLSQIRRWTTKVHALGKQAWVAGSVTMEQLAPLAACQVDVICVRGAACDNLTSRGRMGDVTAEKVRELASYL